MISSPGFAAAQRRPAQANGVLLVGTEAAGTLLEEAHDNLIHSVKQAWPSWRKQLVKDAAAAHTAAAEAMEQAAAATALAKHLYAGVGSLDLGVLERYPKFAEAVLAERKGGVAWYASICNGQRPLERVDVPGVTYQGKHVTLDLAVVVEALRLAVAAPADFAAGDAWSPPSDPDHDAMRDAPLDLTAPWVIRAVRQECGSTCPICRMPHADTVVLDGSTLVLVHAKCGARAPSAKEKQHAERSRRCSAPGFRRH